MGDDRKKAVVLLSGGLDSATALAEAKVAGFAPYSLTIWYGQRHAVERDAARRVAQCWAWSGTSSRRSTSAPSAAAP